MKTTTFITELQTRLETKSLINRIRHISIDFLLYVDKMTISYHKTKMGMQPDEFNNFRITNLTTREKNESIKLLKILKQDIDACIRHLEN